MSGPQTRGVAYVIFPVTSEAINKRVERFDFLLMLQVVVNRLLVPAIFQTRIVTVHP